MLTVLILAQSPAFANSVRFRLQNEHQIPAERLHQFNVGLPPQADRYIVEFQNLYQSILQYIPQDWAEGTAPICVLTDLQGYDPFEFKHLNPLGANGWAPVLGMLILALPEVNWVFAGCSFPENADIERGSCTLARDADFSSILEWIDEAALCPLFDPMGVRNKVRQVCMGQDMHRIPIRAFEQAAAVDDEREYAFFHCYVAYRFGYCGHVVATSGMMERLFCGKKQLPIKLIFEDLFLNFPDRHIPGLSDLRIRDQRYEMLAAIPIRVIVTTGYERDRQGVGAAANRIYLDELQADGMWNAVIQKPVAGVYRLWEASGIAKRVKQKNYREDANDFCRLSDPRAKGRASVAGHSTPGRLLEVAKRLLDRAASESENPRSACAAIQRAVLATDALELLGGKTATTSLVALAQCHELEALAECQFLGVEGNFDVDSRLADLQREIKTLSIYYNKASQEFSAWNAESTILQRLIQIFRDHNKFNEEQVVLIRERELHRRIWFRRHFGAFGGFLRWLNPAYIIAWYVEFLLRSISSFAIAIATWIFVLTLLYAYSIPTSWSTSLHLAISSFVSMQSPEGGLKGALLLLAGTAGLLHLGVLIAHLYAVVSRR